MIIILINWISPYGYRKQGGKKRGFRVLDSTIKDNAQLADMTYFQTEICHVVSEKYQIKNDKFPKYVQWSNIWFCLFCNTCSVISFPPNQMFHRVYLASPRSSVFVLVLFFRITGERGSTRLPCKAALSENSQI